MSHVLFILLCLIWGSGFILIKWTRQCFGEFDIAALRVILATAALWPLWHLRRQAWPLSRRDLGPLVAVATFGYAVPFWIQPFVIHRTSSAFAGMLISLVPISTIIVSIPLLGAYPNIRQIIGVLGGLGLLGYLFVHELGRSVSLGVLMVAIVTPLTYATANTYIKRRFADVPPLALAIAAMAMSALILLPFSVMVDDVATDEQFPGALLALLVLGAICTGIGTFVFYTLIRHHGPLYASMVSYIIPCVAMAWGWLDRESITGKHTLILAGILIMVALVQSAPQPRR